MLKRLALLLAVAGWIYVFALRRRFRLRLLVSVRRGVLVRLGIAIEPVPNGTVALPVDDRI